MDGSTKMTDMKILIFFEHLCKNFADFICFFENFNIVLIKIGKMPKFHWHHHKRNFAFQNNFHTFGVKGDVKFAIWLAIDFFFCSAHKNYLFDMLFAVRIFFQHFGNRCHRSYGDDRKFFLAFFQRFKHRVAGRGFKGFTFQFFWVDFVSAKPTFSLSVECIGWLAF